MTHTSRILRTLFWCKVNTTWGWLAVIDQFLNGCDYPPPYPDDPFEMIVQLPLKDRLCLPMGFPCGSAGKESACNVGDLGSIPGLGRSPEEGKGYPLQYSGLENSKDCIVHGVTKSGTWLSNFHFISPHPGIGLAEVMGGGTFARRSQDYSDLLSTMGRAKCSQLVDLSPHRPESTLPKQSPQRDQSEPARWPQMQEQTQKRAQDSPSRVQSKLLVAE